MASARAFSGYEPSLAIMMPSRPISRVDDRPEGVERCGRTSRSTSRRRRAGRPSARPGTAARSCSAGQDDLAARVEDEPDVEVPVRPVGVAGLGLRHDVDVVLPGDLAERVGLRARDVDRALSANVT